MSKKFIRKIKKRYILLIVVLACIIYYWITTRIVFIHPPQPLSFDGNSEQLSQTLVVPTLDTPTEPGKNVIWCLSSQLAWDALKDDVIRQPIEVANAEDVTQRLNQAAVSAKDILQESYYARAGYAKDDIYLQIQQDMAQRFPNVNVSDLIKPDAQTAIMAYAYLQAAVKFEIPFLDYYQPLEFLSGGKGTKKTAVEAFGIWIAKSSQRRKILEQIEVLFCEGYGQPKECAIDPSKNTKPYQVILAIVPWQGTLQETIVYTEDKIINASLPDYERDLNDTDKLLIPRIAWKLRHHFSELEGEDKLLNNPGFEGLYIDKAIQDIEFSLDRTGASVASGFFIPVLLAPRYFIFDKPFLVYMKIRSHDKPFFAMWVENAELLYPAKD
ncbi:MAG: hypothetical protein JW709_00355 [Sedimentisphaerales bacterium]|nr:hypothetical protein [Sedimentisphaerales bacterium]